MMSREGQTIRIRMEDVRVMGRSTQGVRLVNLNPDDCLVAIQRLEKLQVAEETSENE